MCQIVFLNSIKNNNFIQNHKIKVCFLANLPIDTEIEKQVVLWKVNRLRNRLIIDSGKMEVLL